MYDISGKHFWVYEQIVSFETGLKLKHGVGPDYRQDGAQTSLSSRGNSAHFSEL